MWHESRVLVGSCFKERAEFSADFLVPLPLCSDSNTRHGWLWINRGEIDLYGLGFVFRIANAELAVVVQSS